MQARVVHSTFAGARGRRLYEGDAVGLSQANRAGYLPDEVTRDCARRMHYAAYRATRTADGQEAARWRQRYYDLRDHVILGNQKLVFRMVRKQPQLVLHADDLIGECYLVMIHAVEAYNPWFGVRFSTYACTCLQRALGRLGQRLSADRLRTALALEVIDDSPAMVDEQDDAAFRQWLPVAQYLDGESVLLSGREKSILRHRFCLSKNREVPTLQAVGDELGICKERVRQLQASALGKLRQALAVSDD